MAQAHAEKIEEDIVNNQEKEIMKINNNTTSNNNNGNISTSSSSASAPFKFNVQAPEFVPRSHTQMPISGYYYPCFQYIGGTATGSADWIFVGDQEPVYVISSPSVAMPSNTSKNVLTDDLRAKIIKQVEYQFSDMSLLANETLSKHMNKDPEVPLSVIGSMKKIKSLVGSNHLLAQALRSSSKLSCTVVAENLPEDHSHQNLEKIFGVVGSVKTIRICHPPESNSSRAKSDFFVSNKLHALVEYESTDIAEKAVEKLNDERNWRKGLRVRVLLRCSPKSVLKTKKSEFEGILDDEEADASEDSSHPNNQESVAENNNVEENSGGSKKGWARGRGKGRGRAQSHNSRSLLTPPPQSSNATQNEASAKQTFKGPRMPDGTRGFTMGRGKPLSSPVPPSSP
ncbi:La-related protein 6C [Citrus sinensis]|nr:La-related protein 6C [Citrus sinensis]